jgi:tyrosine-protein kinase Etk/Wzc
MNELIVAQGKEISSLREMPLQRDDDVDVRALLQTLSEHRWLILIGTGLFFLAAVLYVRFATPVYEATAMVQVERNMPRVPGQDSQPAQIDRQTGSQAVTEIPLLTSRGVLGEAVSKLSLDIGTSPRRLPLVGDLIARQFSDSHPGQVNSPWFGLSRYGWGGEQLKVASLDVPDEMLDVPLTLVAGSAGKYTLADGNGNVLLHGQVGQTVNAGGITMAVRELQANPGTVFDVVRRSELAAVNDLAGNITAVERGRDSGIVAISYRNRDPKVALGVLSQITSAYLRRNIQRNSAEAEKSLAFVNEQLPKVRAELDKAQAALNAFQKRVGTVDINLQTSALLNQVVALNASIQQLRTQQPEIARRFTPNHPAYQSLQKQIGGLEADKASLQKRIAELPDIQQGLFRLTRDVEVTNQTYTNLLDQAQQLDIARASAIGNVRLIDVPAVDAVNPVWPMKLPVIAGATLLGGLLMVAFVFLRQVLNRSVEDPADIEQLGLPVYASILLSAQQRDALSRRRRSMRPNLLALNAPADLAMEALRGLRTSLHFARSEPANNLLMITGPSSGVGKTFVASNLAVTIAQTGQRVLLIDADMRRGTMHEVVGTRPEDGLSELLAGEITLETAIRRIAGTDNLSFIPRGKLPTNPSELLMHANFGEMLELVSGQYDLVVIDTPPVLAVTDAVVIGNHVGTSLLVVRFGHNQQREIALAKQRLEQNGVQVEGAIVNGVQKRASSLYTYGYYGHRPKAA